MTEELSVGGSRKDPEKESFSGPAFEEQPAVE